MRNITEFMERALVLPDRAMTFAVGRHLAELFPDQEVLECYERFDIDGFIHYGHGNARLVERMAQEVFASWDADRSLVRRHLVTSWIEVEWRCGRFQVMRAQRHKCGVIAWIVGPADRVESFIGAVLKFGRERSPRTYIYSGWWKDAESFDRAIDQASWDGIVLPHGRRELLELHSVGFFASEQEFRSLGVPWKRGILLTGPPGNGKTHAIRALLNSLQVPRIVVKSFGDDSDDVQEIFDKARELSPCVLIMEDLDALVKPALLSTVLNHLDGTEPLEGVLALATTNHPEKLDPAIRNRPSRFDRVIEFSPPGADERRRMLVGFLSTRPKELKLDEDQAQTIVEATEGFSYAFVKELVVSGCLLWTQERPTGGMFEILLRLTRDLREQIAVHDTDKLDVDVDGPE